MKWRIGEVTVGKIVELEVTGGSRFILPQATREAMLPIDWLQPDFADELGRLKMSIHALVVETPSRRIIVDTCLGNDKENRRIPTWNKVRNHKEYWALDGPSALPIGHGQAPSRSESRELRSHPHAGPHSCRR